MDDALAQLASKIAKLENSVRREFGTENLQWYQVIELSNSYELVRERVATLTAKADRLLATLRQISADTEQALSREDDGR